MLLSLPRQVVLLFYCCVLAALCRSQAVTRKVMAMQGKTERIHADILNHSGAARDKELVEFISARIGGTGHSADQCFLHKAVWPRPLCLRCQTDGR